MLHRLPILVASLRADVDGRALFTFAPVSTAPLLGEASVGSSPARYTILGYRQTEKPASKGGRANANYFRIRHKAMRAFGRSFAGQPFITDHDWGDVRARGGTIVKAWTAAPSDASDELAVYMDVVANVDWARDGLADGTVDRFSIGAIGYGDVMCTVHGGPVFGDCWCWPGRIVVDEKGVERLVEWEHEEAEGVELSAVNVPAVDGTGIVEQLEQLELEDFDAAPIAAALEQLGALCGRPPNITAIRELAAGRRAPTSPAAPDPAAPDPAELVELRRQLAATNRELEVSRAREREAVEASERLHAETAIEQLRGARSLTDVAIERLRAIASTGRAAFDAALAIAAETAPRLITAASAPLQRARLQSDAEPAIAPGGDARAEVDAYEQHMHNPELHRLMKRCGVTAAQVRKHGSSIVNVVPELKDKIQETAARGA